MKKLFSLLLAVILILPMGAQEGGENMANYLTFASAEPFTIAVYNATKNWDGTLYYSTDAATWNEWDGTTEITSAAHGGEHKIYMRGSGNTKITGGNKRWSISGSNVRCNGNIENLLDYETVANGEHPVMANYCYSFLFADCASLITAPELPAIKLTPYCYYFMFRNCTCLIQAPALPATKLANYCYEAMFSGCTSLIQAPVLPATTLAWECYWSMFAGCISLSQIPELPATTLSKLCYKYMFSRCTSLKLSTTQSDEYPNEYRIPTSGTGIYADDALTNMFGETGGTFTGTPSINTTYYTSNKVVSNSNIVEAVVMCNQVTENSFVAWLLAVGLDSSKEYTAVFDALENDDTGVGSKTFTFSRSSVSQSCEFTGLKPNTDYVVYVDLYTEDRLVFSGECEVTTLEGDPVVVRDSFPLGFASGLCGLPITEADADYNTWAQGWLAGAAMRKIL